MASWGKSAQPGSTCEVPEMGQKEKDKMGKSQGSGRENSRKRNFQC